MNLVTLITGTVIAMAVVELLLQGMPRMKRDLFYLAMLVAWVGFTSKYYYGPDIKVYNMIFENTGTLSRFVQGEFSGDYEIGYLFYVSLCKTIGLDFWWMTAIISTLYFYSVFHVLKRLKDRRVLALALLIVLVQDMIYAQLRQCFSVAFFTLAIVQAEDWRQSGFKKKKDALTAVLLGVISMTLHKSGIPMVAVAALYYWIQPYMMRKNTWSVLLLLLLLLTLVPTLEFIEAMTDMLNLSELTMHSIRYHLSYMNLRQTNLLVYGTVLVVLAMYAKTQERKGAIVSMAAIGMIVIVLFYQYYFMVNRLRSYFVIFIIYYIFSELRRATEERAPYVLLVRQACEVAIVLFMAGKTYSFDVNMRKEQGNLLDACTVFDLVDNDAETLRKRQLAKADKFWEADDDKQRTDSRFASKNYSKNKEK